MVTDINNSKEVIKNRMLKHALTYWGIKNTEDLDPVVKLIMEALSSELYNLGNEIKDTQVRILEKIANLLSPDFLTCSTPAHAIMHALPAEPTEVLLNTASFYTQRKISSRQNEILDTSVDILFTPVDSVRVFDAQVLHLVTGSSFYSYDSAFNKQLAFRSKVKSRETNTVWLGLKLNGKLEDVQNMFFYFDWKNLVPEMANRAYHLLPLTKWSIGEVEIATTPGINYVASLEENEIKEDIFSDYNLLSLIEKDVKNLYDAKYVSISNSIGNKINELKQHYPSELEAVFPQNDLAKLNQKLVWCKIEFPAGLHAEALDELNIYSNAFPVMNRQVTELKYRLKGGSNIIPLKTGLMDQFLCVKSLSDEAHRYKAVPYRKQDEEQTGTYSLRNGGVERFDNRNARDLINYLLELSRSESAAFAAFGYDFIAGTLKEMNQRIFLMEQKTKGFVNNANEVPNYIIVKPFEGNELMFAEYWSTLAEIANNLKAGTRLQLAKGAAIKQDSMILLTTSFGGKSRLKPEEKLNAFRYGIITRNRIITKEDIRSFCFYELGEQIEKVEVERGFEMCAEPKEAFRRTIDVILTQAQDETITDDTWINLCEQLKSKLQLRSGMNSNYRVLLKK